MTKRIESLRERQKASTRRDIFLKGMELFLRQGFDNTTIDHIVEPLGIAKRTFFRYFETKEDLVFAFSEDKTLDLVDELKVRPKDENPFKAVCEAIAVLLKRYDENPEMAFEFIRLTKETPSLAGKNCEKRIVWEEALTEALLEREDSNGLSTLKAQIIVGTAMAAFHAAIDEWYAGGGKQNLRPIVETAYRIASEK